MKEKKSSSTAYPMCRICESRHRQGEPHIWKDEPKKKKIAAVMANIPVKPASELPEKGLDNTAKNPHGSLDNTAKRAKFKQKGLDNTSEVLFGNIDPMRQVNMKALYRNLSGELQALPFEITKGGEVIAVVMSKGGN